MGKSIRRFQTARALESVVALRDVVNELTEDEVLHCLQIESSSQRRKAVIETLIRRAAQINRKEYIRALRSKYDPPPAVEDFAVGSAERE